MTNSNEQFDYLVEQHADRQENTLRVYTIAKTGGALALPECVAALTGREDATLAALSSWSNLALAKSRRKGDSSPTDFKPTDEETAVVEAVNFMGTHVATTEPQMSEDFFALVSERMAEIQAKALEELAELAGGTQEAPEPELHTGFYL